MITTITGKNTYLAAHALAKLRQEFSEAYGDSNIIEMSAPDVSMAEIQQALMSQGLFSAETLLILKDLADNKQLQEQLPGMFEEISDSSHLVIYEPQLDRRTRFFKALKQTGTFEDFGELDEQQLARWAADEFKQLGASISAQSIRYLIERIGTNQWQLHQEIQKLSLLEGEITKRQIETMVSENFRATIFNLLDAAFARNSAQALQLYRDLRANKVEAQYVMNMLIWQLHILALVVFAGDRSDQQIASENKLSPYVVQKTRAIARQTSKDQLKDILKTASVIDVESKTLPSYDMGAAVDLLIARIASD